MVRSVSLIETLEAGCATLSQSPSPKLAMLPCMAGPAEPCPESASGNGGLLGDRAEDQQLLQSQLKDWVMRADLNTRLARHTQRGGDEAIILQVAAADRFSLTEAGSC